MTVTTFSELELDESLLDALQDKGFTRPTAIQAAAIPPPSKAGIFLAPRRQAQAKQQLIYCPFCSI